MAKYLQITTAGEFNTIDLGEFFAGLDDIYEATKCQMVQIVQLEDGLTMWVDEEGKYSGRLVNDTATTMFWNAFGATDYIMGDVILTGGEDSKGRITGLSDKKIAEIQNDLIL
jgi:hypothetical protein